MRQRVLDARALFVQHKILFADEAFGHLAGVTPVFFFQAEDGIRDLTVTGVQTCALPISSVLAGASADRWAAFGFRYGSEDGGISSSLSRSRLSRALVVCQARSTNRRFGFPQIGRASCRERV